MKTFLILFVCPVQLCKSISTIFGTRKRDVCKKWGSKEMQKARDAPQIPQKGP
jgi:hypothetical protein